ncbi:MAG TPA: hypothetical protein PLZ86_03085 [bacterium]|nr:hypothetical protein [bacterium]
MSRKFVALIGVLALSFSVAGCEGFGTGGEGTDPDLGSSVETPVAEIGGCPVTKEQKIATVSYDLGNYCGSASFSTPIVVLFSGSPHYADAINESNRNGLFCMEVQALLAGNSLSVQTNPADIDEVIKAVESYCADVAESIIEKLRNEAPASLMESDVANLLLLYRPVRQFCAEFGLANGMAPPAWLAGAVESCTASLASSETDKGKTTVSAGTGGGSYMDSDSFKRNLAMINARNCDMFRLWLNRNSKEGLQKILDECAAQDISTDALFEKTGAQGVTTTGSAVAKTDAISFTTAGGLTQRDMIKQFYCHNAALMLAQLNGDFSSCK